MLKRKKYSALAEQAAQSTLPVSVVPFDTDLLPAKPRASERKSRKPAVPQVLLNPDKNSQILDGPQALRASPDASGESECVNVSKAGSNLRSRVKEEDGAPVQAKLADSDSPLSEISDVESPSKPTARKTGSSGSKKIIPKEPKVAIKKPQLAKKVELSKEPQFLDPEADGDEDVGEEEIQVALSRPPPVNSDYLPLPWKGRLGYACLCTYLRFSNPPVFSSRTCRIASILENRHPLKYPDQPPHATKNRPDKDQPASVARGQAYVESIGLANAKDIVKMIRWNDKYGIKFMRLSSEMFPFASHEEYGYRLAPFASGALAEAGKVAAELGHRLTTHPGQFTQLGSPRKQVIENALRDLEYHSELLSLLNLPPRQNRDAVMILHLGGVFGDKAATLDRFRENYARLSSDVKARLVLENDDMSWSVHDLLPICEELNIPMVLDFHHHNIIFDSAKIREGTKDIMDLYPRILATWKRKNITPKMHYSEPTPAAITGSQRRKHNPRVATLPPCPPDMDLMIEAKDKEQAVFELMRSFKLPGFDTFNDMIPHVRKDDNKPMRTPKKKPKQKSSKAKNGANGLESAEEQIEAENELEQEVITDDEVGMGGPEGRVYWPPGMEDWLRPVKRIVTKKETGDIEKATPNKKRKAAAKASEAAVKLEEEVQQDDLTEASLATPTPAKKVKATPKRRSKPAVTSNKNAKRVPTPSTSDEEASEALLDLSPDERTPPQKVKAAAARKSLRSKKISYAEKEEQEDDE